MSGAGRALFAGGRDAKRRRFAVATPAAAESNWVAADDRDGGVGPPPGRRRGSLFSNRGELEDSSAAQAADEHSDDRGPTRLVGKEDVLSRRVREHLFRNFHLWLVTSARRKLYVGASVGSRPSEMFTDGIV